jgi:hypothetical protein
MEYMQKTSARAGIVPGCQKQPPRLRNALVLAENYNNVKLNSWKEV